MSYQDLKNIPEMKLDQLQYIHRKKIKAHDEIRRRDELKRVNAALKALANDPERDELITEAVKSIQDAAVPAIVKIDDEEIIVGNGSNTLEAARRTIEGELAQSHKPGSPSWLPILWESMLESLEVKFKVGISIPPVDISITLDAIKFVQLVTKRRAEHV